MSLICSLLSVRFKSLFPLQFAPDNSWSGRGFLLSCSLRPALVPSGCRWESSLADPGASRCPSSRPATGGCTGVISMLSWPRSPFTAMRDTPGKTKRDANVCRSPWVVIRFPRPAFLHVAETMSATAPALGRSLLVVPGRAPDHELADDEVDVLPLQSPPPLWWHCSPRDRSTRCASALGVAREYRLRLRVVR
jgi:hypothetical protein